MEVAIKRVNNAFHMEAVNTDGNSVDMDANIQIGGVGAGVRPMEMVAMAAGGCSSIDVLNMLYKQRLQPTGFGVKVRGERKDAVPAVFEKLTLSFEVEGDIPADKLLRAVQLSVEKYCSVSKMLEPAVEIRFEISLNHESIV